MEAGLPLRLFEVRIAFVEKPVVQAMEQPVYLREEDVLVIARIADQGLATGRAGGFEPSAPAIR